MTKKIDFKLETDTKINTGFPAVYRILWRWHFYAGIFCVPFILTLAISGTIYLFKPQIDAYIDKPFHNLPIMESRSTANQQISAALDTVPGSSFINYRLPENSASAVVISINDSQQATLVYVNPYTLEVLKTIKIEDQFIRMVRNFHGELMAGNIGSIIIELAGCWAIVLIISGLYLWWPRSSKGLAGVIYPRLNLKGRLFWRDLHSVLGMWVSVFTLFLLVSGLPWALVWGSAFKEVRNFNSAPEISSAMVSNQSGSNEAASDEHEEHNMENQNNSTAVQQDWTLSRAEEIKELANNKIFTHNLSEELLNTAVELDFSPPVQLSIDRQDSRVWVVNSQDQNRMLRSKAWVESESARIIRTENFSDRSKLDKVIGIGIAAHEGQLFGWFNQLLGVFTTLALSIVSVSGFIMWRKRKPEARLGAPQKIKNAWAGKVVTTTILALCALLPLLLISVIGILLIEWLVIRRFNRSKDWFGMNTN